MDQEDFIVLEEWVSVFFGDNVQQIRYYPESDEIRWYYRLGFSDNFYRYLSGEIDNKLISANEPKLFT